MSMSFKNKPMSGADKKEKVQQGGRAALKGRHDGNSSGNGTGNGKGAISTGKGNHHMTAGSARAEKSK
jgi:hypothetical protein